ncbi:EAL domain-containing protein, partial [Hungatella hathewayi]
SYLYRINGDVFLGISQSEENAEAFAIRLEKMLVNLVTVKTISVPLRVRIVACQYPTHGDTPYVLLERIQAAMNFSKVSDRNVVVYDDELDALLRTDVEILHRLTQAIDQKSLEIWYQPARNLKNGRFDAAEALVKLPDGNGGYFSAGQVVSLAERNGKVRELGEYVLKHACSFMRRRGDSLGLKDIAVNVSVQQLLVENSAEHLLKLIGETGVDPRRVILEITESVLIQSIDHAAQTLERLRQAGIRIALDDFGVGYSSLNYLSNLPVDIIKIDHSLAQQIRTNKKQHMLLKSIVELAAVNDLLVVTEGVETEEDQKLIEAAGVHYIQGYYYARPMPEDALIAFLNEQ